MTPDYLWLCSWFLQSSRLTTPARYCYTLISRETAGTCELKQTPTGSHYVWQEPARQATSSRPVSPVAELSVHDVSKTRIRTSRDTSLHAVSIWRPAHIDNHSQTTRQRLISLRICLHAWWDAFILFAQSAAECSPVKYAVAHHARCFHVNLVPPSPPIMYSAFITQYCYVFCSTSSFMFCLSASFRPILSYGITSRCTPMHVDWYIGVWCWRGIRGWKMAKNLCYNSS